MYISPCVYRGPILIQAMSVGPPLILIKEQMHCPVPSAVPLFNSVCVCVCVCVRACPLHVPLLCHIVQGPVAAPRVEDELAGSG